MSTLFFNSNDIKIYRRRRVGSTNRYSVSVTLTVVDADIQPASIERTQLAEGLYGAVFDAYVDQSVDIKEGDQVVDTASGKRYSVKGVSNWESAGLLAHKELLLVSLDS